MDGILIDGRRPKSKKEVKERIEIDPFSVTIEHTSHHGPPNDIGEPKGFTRVPYLMPNSEIHFVGPDPYTQRNFYGVIRVLEGKKVIVK